MRRRTVHAAFAALAVICAGAVAYQTVQLRAATRVNDAIAKASTVSADSSLPEAQFARAVAMARSGKTEAALKSYKDIAQGARPDLRVAALYNLGNLHLREAQRVSSDDATQSLPLIELAKQSYRDVLRAQPQDWDTRYNLERALQLAPELDDTPFEEEEKEAPEEHVSSTLQGARMDLP
jgi:mxaK protein